MSLQLSNFPKFRADIQSKETQLIPLVVLGDYYISTNSQAVTVDGEAVAPLPILLNVPSLKESIDIDKRNFRISSVTLQLSNFTYDHVRFSDRVGNNSLINKECKIYWTSPSATTIRSPEFIATEGDGDDNAFLIYNGILRKYQHSDEKVTLTIEDMSQLKLHKDLPLQENYLGTTDNIPSKYQNKPIPMVYGHVDRSPCVVSNDGTIGQEGDVYQGDMVLQVDVESVEMLEEPYLDSTSLFIYKDNKHHAVNKIFKNNTYGDFLTINQYERDGAYIIFPGTDPRFQSEIGSDFMPVAFNELEVTSFGNPQLVKVWDTFRWLLTEDGYTQCQDTATTGSGLLDIPSSSNLEGLSNATYSTIGSNQNSNSSYAMYAQKVKHGIGTIVGSGLIDVSSEELKFKFLIAFRLTYPSISPSQNSKVYFELFPYAEIGLDGTGDYVDLLGSWEHTLTLNVGWGLARGDFNYAGYAPIAGSSDQTSIYYNIPEPPNQIVDRVAVLEHNGTGVELNQGDYQQPDTEPIPMAGYQDEMTITDDGQSPNVGEFLNNVIITFETGGDGGGNDAFIMDVDNYRAMNDMQVKFHSAFHRVHYYMPDIRSNEFYANVQGRLGSSPTSMQVIKSILSNELGYLGGVNEPTDSSYNWQYAFTINKKINSKKLIEGIASVSPYLPRFDNMGEFTFDQIKEIYTKDDILSTGKIIEQLDIINYSFSRTDIENVYTKVIFKYNWDYAKEEFMSEISAGIVDGQSRIVTSDGDVSAGPDASEGNINPDNAFYQHDYYGFNTDAIHEDSTLVIDDDRGKYIRNDDTAGEFARWFLEWHCNQHLKMRIKLPLSYLDLEIGSLVAFNEVVGDVKPYGINYSINNAFELDTLGLGNFTYSGLGDLVNGQQAFPTFMVISSNKTLDHVEIECIQMHNLSGSAISGNAVLGCGINEEGILNYNPDVTIHQPGSCLVMDDFIWRSGEGDDGEYNNNADVACCFQYHPSMGDVDEDQVDIDTLDEAANYVDGAAFDESGDLLKNPDGDVKVFLIEEVSPEYGGAIAYWENLTIGDPLKEVVAKYDNDGNLIYEATNYSGIAESISEFHYLSPYWNDWAPRLFPQYACDWREVNPTFLTNVNAMLLYPNVDFLAGAYAIGPDLSPFSDVTTANVAVSQPFIMRDSASIPHMMESCTDWHHSRHNQDGEDAPVKITIPLVPDASIGGGQYIVSGQYFDVPTRIEGRSGNNYTMNFESTSMSVNWTYSPDHIGYDDDGEGELNEYETLINSLGYGVNRLRWNFRPKLIVWFTFGYNPQDQDYDANCEQVQPEFIPTNPGMEPNEFRIKVSHPSFKNGTLLDLDLSTEDIEVVSGEARAPWEHITETLDLYTDADWGESYERINELYPPWKPRIFKYVNSNDIANGGTGNSAIFGLDFGFIPGLQRHGGGSAATYHLIPYSEQNDYTSFQTYIDDLWDLYANITGSSDYNMIYNNEVPRVPFGGPEDEGYDPNYQHIWDYYKIKECGYKSYPIDIELQFKVNTIDQEYIEHSRKVSTFKHIQLYFENPISNPWCLEPGEEEEEEAECIKGDLTGDGGWNVLDIVALVNCILLATCGYPGTACEADMNDDGGYNVQDIVILANCVLTGTCGDL